MQKSSFRKREVVLFNQVLGADKRVHIFLKGIRSKMTVIARQELELAYYSLEVQLAQLRRQGNFPITWIQILLKVLKAYNRTA